jgi:hypothetical protein
MVSVAGGLAISPVRLIGFRGPLEQIATSIALAVAAQRRSARATWIGWNSSSTDFCPRWISLCIGVGTLIERPDVDGNENRPGLVILTCYFVVELPGIEPASLPGNLPSELQVRSVSVRFIPARYLRFRSRVLTASRQPQRPRPPSGPVS